jgi:hypothetical protein
VIALSSHGEIEFDGTTGQIVENKTKGYINIARFDVEEWKEYYKGEKLEGDIDILDLGYWETNGTYVPPVEAWRQDFKCQRQST